MDASKRQLAFLAYLVPVFGWLYVLLFHGKDELASYHAKQSMMLAVTAVAAPLVWALAAWILVWVPLIGSAIAAALFALVILTYLFLAALWVTGMVYAVQAKAKALPVVGQWAERIS